MTLTHDLHTSSSGLAHSEQLAQVLSAYVDELERGAGRDPDELLAAHPELADQLDGYLDSLKWLQQAMGQMRAEERPPAVQPQPQGQIGDYQIVREIGRGGMGVVYEARQLSLGRTVALKLLPFSGLLDQKQIARFRNEAQAAAALHHPHIVPVFAVGCENGVHFYSMQFIDGQPLGRVISQLRGDFETPSADAAPSQPADPPAGRPWQPRDIWDVPSTLDLARIPTPSTVEVPRGVQSTRAGSAASARTRNYVRNVAQLLVQAADALQHAHECGVIHRDIKPSNLIVDRHGKLWITDFGLARSTVGPDLTVTGDLLGTARYMSPEQAAGRTQLVDHRTDVYSLGITLYEVLTLQPAFTGEDHQEVLRQVREESPPPPRARNPAVPYDLETIVLKAIAKSRDDRYASAAAFADDLRRFLAGESPQARRPTALDRTAKWLVRHRRITATAALLTVLALAGVSVAACLLAAQQQETDRALQNTRSLLRELTQVVDRMGAGVSDQLRDVEGAEQVRSQLLLDTLAGYEALRQAADDSPDWSADAATAAFKAAAAHEQLGNHAEALRLYRDSRDRFAALVATSPQSLSWIADHSLAVHGHGVLLSQLGDPSAGLVELERAASQQAQLVQLAPTSSRYRQDLALTQVNRAATLAQLGRTDAAMHAYREAIAGLRSLILSGHSTPSDQQRLATALHNLSGLVAVENVVEADTLARDASEILRRLPGRQPRAELGVVLSHRGNLLADQGLFADALPLFAEAIALQNELVRKAPDRVTHRFDLAVVLNNRGKRLLQCGDWEAAAVDLTEARSHLEKLVRQNDQVPAYLTGLATVLENLAQIWEQQGDLAAAVDTWQEAVRRQTAACGISPDVTQYHEQLARHRANLQRVLASAGKSHDVKPAPQPATVLTQS